MTKQHPEFEDEQRFIDHAYECLEITKTDAWKIRAMNEASMGGTFQARFERNAFDEVLVGRLTQLVQRRLRRATAKLVRYISRKHDSGQRPTHPDLLTEI